MQRVIAVEPHFDVIAEGYGWIVVNKAAPLVVHPTKGMDGSNEPTLLGGLDALLAYELANGARLGLINRLDRETSGLVVIATSRERARELHMAIEHRQVTKAYIAIAHGWPEWDERVICEPIGRAGDFGESAIYLKQAVHPAGRACKTQVRVKERLIWQGRKICRLDVSPRTGRMHQIRVHLAWAGHSIIGDKIYGEDERCYLDFIEHGFTKDLGARLMHQRHCLHASEMIFPTVGMSWRAPLAADMKEILAAAQRPDRC